MLLDEIDKLKKSELTEDKFCCKIEELLYKYKINFLKISSYLGNRTQYFIIDQSSLNNLLEIYCSCSMVNESQFNGEFINLKYYNYNLKPKHILLLKMFNKIKFDEK